MTACYGLGMANMNELDGRTLLQLSENLYLLEDTCNVYLVRSEEHGLLVDAGSGAVAELAPTIGVHTIDWVLHTHFHRDQCWGTPRLVEQNAVRVAVPEYERFLFERAQQHLDTRRIFDKYSGLRCSFGPGDDIRVDRTLDDYEAFEWRGVSFHVLPAKGHTLGSSALLAEIDGRSVAFTGDLITAGGHVHELHALEYSYGDTAGVLFTLQSLQALRSHRPDRLLPSHGPSIDDVDREIDLLQERLLAIARLGSIVRSTGPNIVGKTGPMEVDPAPVSLPEPELVQVSEHLLWSGPNACSNFYVLLSGTGEALLVDYGCPHYSYLHVDRDQSSFESVRFVVHRLDQLRERFGVREIEVVCATHTHDDHVCGIPYLQRHHETECWALEQVADVLERPAYWSGLACTIPKPIEAHRKLRDGERAQWRGFELTFHHAPGHAEFHSVISAEVDGRTVAFTGDNYFVQDLLVDGERVRRLGHNIVLQNGFRPAMYGKSVDVLRSVAPDLICPGHDVLIPVGPADLDHLSEFVRRAGRAFSEVVAAPADQSIDVWWARLNPYLSSVGPGTSTAYTLTLRNDLERRATYEASLLAPSGWSAPDGAQTVELEAGESAALLFTLTAPEQGTAGRRLVTAEVRIDGRSHGPIAEAVVAFDAGS